MLIQSYLFFILSRSISGMCYYPNGTPSEDTPCNPRQHHSMCCGVQDICLSDQLCFVTSQNRLRRGSCTDPSWSAGNCAEICTGPGDGDNSTWADVMSCPGSLPGVWFCGYENVARCSAGPDQKTFNLPSGYFADFRNSTPTATGTIPARTTVLSTTTVFASNSSPVITSYPTSDPASISNSSHQLCTADIATQTRIGVGVGLPLGISLIGAVILLFRERNMRRKTERSELTKEKRWPSSREELEATQHPLEADSTPKVTHFEAPN